MQTPSEARLISQRQLLSSLQAKCAELIATFANANQVSSIESRSKHEYQKQGSESDIKNKPPLINELNTEKPSKEDIIRDARATVKTHIRQLGEYNALKDAAQTMMGIIAERKGVLISAVMEDFGLHSRD